ncbi:MAG: alpha/beta fold hydrolase [Burkholderiaceae bacterium]
MSAVVQKTIPGPGGDMAVYVQGDRQAPAVFLTHSILSSSMMWDEQARILAETGWYVVRADTRGHGASQAPQQPYAMADLVADTVAVLDALRIERAHYIGLSLGGMSGLGLGIHYADRLLSLCICDARADAPPAVAAPWDERIAIAAKEGCCALAQPTIERWFGKAFLDAHPDVAQRFFDTAAATSAEGFSGCARAIQGLNYLADVSRISTPTTLVVGGNDGVLPQVMRELQALIPGAVLAEIPSAGHLPNIDQPVAFNTVLWRHFIRVASGKPMQRNDM